jgi:hypothetical protein
MKFYYPSSVVWTFNGLLWPDVSDSTLLWNVSNFTVRTFSMCCDAVFAPRHDINRFHVRCFVSTCAGLTPLIPTSNFILSSNSMDCWTLNVKALRSFRMSESVFAVTQCHISEDLKLPTCSRNDQQYALIVPLLYSIYWLLHVSAVACHHQGAS